MQRRFLGSKRLGGNGDSSPKTPSPATRRPTGLDPATLTGTAVRQDSLRLDQPRAVTAYAPPWPAHGLSHGSEPPSGAASCLPAPSQVAAARRPSRRR